ncbi:hypothetical protein CPB85DRAFT_1326159 [Mucidula mucida]|nr:hypothetical protein CPB85DRAFT_1326159 [Mucidula mucida]
MHVQNTVHYQLNGSLAEAQWSSLIPEGGGIVRLGPNREPFMLSMYHQLRCLDLIRKAYIHGANGDRSFDAAAGHCLNYIRQMVFCRGDLRLERVVDPNGPHAVQVRETTTCQDWTAVYNKVHEVHGRDVV